MRAAQSETREGLSLGLGRAALLQQRHGLQRLLLGLQCHARGEQLVQRVGAHIRRRVRLAGLRVLRDGLRGELQRDGHLAALG